MIHTIFGESMKRYFVAGIAAMFLLSFKSAQAGPYGDGLSKCLVASTTAADRSLLVKWIFSAESLHKDVSAYVRMPPEIRNTLTKDTAGLYMRLMTESCKKQLRGAYAYEGVEAINNAFQLLGGIATKEIFSDPAVEAAMAELANHFDEAKLKTVLDAK